MLKGRNTKVAGSSFITSTITSKVAAKAGFERLLDKPYDDKKKVRVAGPFTVESLSPHRSLGVNDKNELIDPAVKEEASSYSGKKSFADVIIENLRTAGVQQSDKGDKINFTALNPWPGTLICAEGRYIEGGKNGVERRAGIFIGPEFGTVTRADLVEAAREAAAKGAKSNDFDLSLISNWGVALRALLILQRI